MMDDAVFVLLYMILLLLGVIMLLIFVSKGAQGSTHVCARCGYDLRGHGAQPQRCPECGRSLPVGDRALGRIQNRPIHFFLTVIIVTTIAVAGAAVIAGLFDFHMF